MKRLVLIAALLALVAAACGGDDDDATEAAATGDTRTIEIEMRDIAFSPDAIDVDAGETVRFVFDNSGKVAHDAFVGNEGAQAGHEDEMREDSGMAHGGGDEGITVDPGEEGELTYTFDEPGTVLIGCHQPSHYDTGMKVTVDVT